MLTIVTETRERTVLDTGLALFIWRNKKKRKTNDERVPVASPRTDEVQLLPREQAEAEADSSDRL